MAAALWAGAAWGYDGKVFSLALGAKVKSRLEQRGARTYDGVQLQPIVYAGFFDERIQIFGTSLEFLDFLGTRMLRGRTKLSSVSDDPFLKLAGPVDVRSSRPSTIEWMSRLELFLPSFDSPRVQLDLAYAKELKEHRGDYLELTARLTLARWFLEREKPLVEPQLFATFGFGDSRHNAFWYGAGAGAGASHVEYGLAVVSPARIDRHFPVFRFYRFDILRSPNIGPGQLVGQRGGFQVEATLAFGLW